ncbi:MAG: ABC transporter permease [Bacteroidaceae bacterium]|nr:ABC transporter permease [Bacteroidaceae bacterium]
MDFLQSLNKRGQHNWTKIVCLATGLAVGVVLIGKVGFEQSFDDFFPTSPRTYAVCEDIVRDGEFKHFPQTAGAVAPGLQSYCPQVEAATRFTTFAMQTLILTDDGRRVRGNYALVDSCFFDVFPFRVLAGDARSVLSRPDYCMISRSLAEKLGGGEDVVGTTIYDSKPGALPLTIGGIYEDIPLNSTLHGLEVMVSMPTITKVMWDGRDNWVGNDRYRSFVRLAEGCSPDDLAPQIDQMKHERLPQEELQKAGVELGFSLHRLSDQHTQDEDTRRMTWVLTLLAAVLIGCAVLNYLLFVVAGISRRAREMAVMKCYGATEAAIYAKVMGESALHLLLSLLLAAALLYAGRDVVEEVTAVPLGVLLTAGRNVWMILGVCALVLVITGLVPSWLYARIPVASAFRTYGQSHRLWKQALLGLQLASAAFLVILLVVTARQYRLMVTNDPGYDYSTLGMIQADEIDTGQREVVVEELRKLSRVKGVTAATVMLTGSQNGDNIYLPDDEREYMNVADLFDVGDGYFDVMGLHVAAGRTFTEGTDTLRECMVSRRFEEKMRELAGWDTAVGKEIFCTSYQGLHTIVGVYDDPQIGSLSMPERRPSICFYSRQMRYMPIILIRFHTMEALNDANAVLRRLVPDNPDLAVYPYSQIITQLYTDAQRFRSTVLIGSIIALLIALIGLIGYLAGEVSRRQREIAVRKVNGAYITDVLRLFQRDILRMALPAVVVGSAAAYFVARLWLQQFSRQTPLTLWLFTLCAAAVLAVVIAIVAARSWRIAAGNPVNYLKTE